MICKLSKNKDKQHLDKPKISVYTPNLKEHLQRSFGILAGTTTSAAVVAFPLSLISTFLVPLDLILHLVTQSRVRGQ